MSADTKTATQSSESERFVTIPRARPGQEYKAPKNFQNPLITGFYRLAVVLLSLSLPLAPGVIFVMILAQSKAIELGFLWLWISMIVLIEVIAIAVAWGVAREALGYSGVSYVRARK
ncbi:MAG TPA: hypothetical protein VFQ25_14810 [Ktedonobacterales bacterium]|nr:hypothetical protein [Ktedonobacterales bacterium]